MPMSTSFDLIWRALEDEIDDRLAEGEEGIEISDRALWVDAFHGDRRYELRLALGPAITCLIELEQTAMSGAVDEGLLEADDEWPGGCTLTVEFCIYGPPHDAWDVGMPKRVVEEFWPDVAIDHWSLSGVSGHLRGQERNRHEHFSFSYPVDHHFADRVSEFVDAVFHTMQRLAATVPGYS